MTGILAAHAIDLTGSASVAIAYLPSSSSTSKRPHPQFTQSIDKRRRRVETPDENAVVVTRHVLLLDAPATSSTTVEEHDENEI